MKRSDIFRAAAYLLPLLLLLNNSCDISSGDETVRTVSLNVAGTYVNDAGIPTNQSGATITRITFNQNGDQLEGVDNEGTRWTGSIGRADGDTATVTIRGITTTGVQVVITGSIVVNGTTAVLSGLWVEPSLTSNAFATATVAAGPTPTPTPELTVTPGATVTATPVVTVAPTATPTP